MFTRTDVMVQVWAALITLDSLNSNHKEPAVTGLVL